MNSLTEGFLQSKCLSVWAAFWDQDVGVKMSFDNTKPMKINFRQNLRGLLIERQISEAIEARTSMVVLAFSFSKPVWGQFSLQVKTAI